VFVTWAANNLRTSCLREPADRTALLCVCPLTAAATAFSFPPPNPEPPESLQQSILEAYRAGRRAITIRPGTYRISPSSAGPHLQFKAMSDFDINAAGVDLVFTDQTRGGIDFRDCHNVHFRGASLRYEVPPFTQDPLKRSPLTASGMTYGSTRDTRSISKTLVTSPPN
jgi:hypothetical protein